MGKGTLGPDIINARSEVHLPTLGVYLRVRDHEKLIYLASDSLVLPLGQKWAVNADAPVYMTSRNPAVPPYFLLAEGVFTPSEEPLNIHCDYGKRKCESPVDVVLSVVSGQRGSVPVRRKRRPHNSLDERDRNGQPAPVRDNGSVELLVGRFSGATRPSIGRSRAQMLRDAERFTLTGASRGDRLITECFRLNIAARLPSSPTGLTTKNRPQPGISFIVPDELDGVAEGLLEKDMTKFRHCQGLRLARYAGPEKFARISCMAEVRTRDRFFMGKYDYVVSRNYPRYMSLGVLIR
ncbi:hypothetical protein BD779DRAFT_1790368 [Infundibulicybe gibba]|nr:hypothetical protein BD779DRAFT_1790368 [Infundibulicybe gibba]